MFKNSVECSSRILAEHRETKTAQGQRNASTRRARRGSYSNNDASVSAHPCYWPTRATNNASETGCDKVRCTNFDAGFCFSAEHSAAKTKLNMSTIHIQKIQGYQLVLKWFLFRKLMNNNCCLVRSNIALQTPGWFRIHIFTLYSLLNIFIQICNNGKYPLKHVDMILHKFIQRNSNRNAKYPLSFNLLPCYASDSW